MPSSRLITALSAPASQRKRSGASPGGVHDGSGGQNQVGYWALIQYLVNYGNAIYAINNRGSSGYGKTFDHLDDRKHQDVDLGVW